MAFGDLITDPPDSASAESATTVAVTLSETATGGSLLVAIHFTGADDSQLPTDDGTGTWLEAVVATNSGNADQAGIYYKIASGDETVVTGHSGAADENMMAVYEIEGPWESSPLDETASSGPTDSGSFVSGTTGVTAQDDEVAIVGAALRTSDQSLGSWTNSFIEKHDPSVLITSAKGLGTAYKVLTATGAQSTAASIPGSSEWMGMIATFMKAAAADDAIVGRVIAEVKQIVVPQSFLRESTQEAAEVAAETPLSARGLVVLR